MNITRQEKKQTPTKSFLRWAGSKRQIRSYLLAKLPRDINSRVYYEPFLGAGSLFFALRPKKAELSDVNEHLIYCYKCVRNFPDRIASYLEEHMRKNSESYYYQIRSLYNRTSHYIPVQAARLIYLNKACFNGIFRVNQKGEFNVPYGKIERPALPNAEELNSISRALKSAHLVDTPFEQVLLSLKRNDFVYLDPPYPPLNGTSCFNHYTPNGFTESDHRKLARLVKLLHWRGCLFMLSNADTKQTRSLYSKFKTTEIPVIRYITCKKVRHKVQELVITNYEV